MPGRCSAAGENITEPCLERDRLARAAATAAERNDMLSALVEQQAALRRVATLVARGVSPPEVFSAVAAELARCLGVHYAALWRYEPDGAAIVLAARNDPGLTKMPVGERFSLEGESVAAVVFRSGRATRTRYENAAAGSAAARIRELGLRSAVGAPIVVDGRVWGAAIVGSAQPESLPPGTEARISEFADLVATAIAAATARAELIASRARIVAAADEGRRRLERDLHDGAQQRLVSLGLQARMVEASVPDQLVDLREQLSDIVSGLTEISTDLREISHGIHPAIQSSGGLGPALKTLARRSPVPVSVDVAIDRQLPDSAEVGAYYVVAEALTNMAKHARSAEAHVSAQADEKYLHLSIRDNGIGGADCRHGSGLIGLMDRVEALGGRMTVVSPPGNGTSLDVAIPIG